MKKLYIWMFALLSVWQINAQVSIGSGTGTSSDLPIVSNYGYSYSQQIFLQPEISASGTITSITFTPTTTVTNFNLSKDWVIYLGHTSKTSFSSATDWIPLANLTEVYNGEVTYPATVPGAMTITFTTPFAYNNVDNLVVVIDENTPSFGTLVSWRARTLAANSNRSIYFRSDSNNPNPASPPTATSRASVVNNITLGGIVQACPAPTSPTITGFTAVSADLSWTPHPTSPPSFYDVYYGAGSTATPLAVPTASTAATTTSVNPFTTVTGLTANTSYQYYVRSNCTSDGNSAWVGPYTFYTGYCIPPTVTGTGTYIHNFSTTAGVNNINNLNSNFTTGGYNDLYATAEVSSFEGNIVNVSIGMVGGTAGVALWIDWNNDLTFSDSERIYTSNGFVADGTYNTTIEIPAGTALGSYRMRVRTDYNASNPTPCTNGGTRTETEDYKFSVVAQPSCLAPLNLGSANYTTTTADISWEASTSNPTGGYQYEVRTSGEAGSGATGLVASGSTATGMLSASVSGLIPSTSHVFYVRSMCASGSSSWSASTPFYTLCGNQSIPYVMPIDAVTVPALPHCTTVQNVNNDNRTWVSMASTTGITGKVMGYPYNSTQAANDWLYTSGLNLVAGTSYRLKFKYKDTGYAEKLKVAIGNSADYNAMTTQLFDVTTGSGTTTVSQRVDFTVPADGAYFIGFQCYSALNRNVLYLGEVSVEFSPTDAVDFANLQSFVVGSTEVNSIQTCQSVIAYAQAYEPNVTEADGPAAGLLAWIGYSTTDTDPTTWPASAWTVAPYNVNVGNNDEFGVTYNNLAAGTYYFASRFQLNDGVYKYGASNNGFWNATTNPNKVLTVTTPEVITASSSANSVCAGTSITLTANSTFSDYTYVWDNGAGTGASVNVSPSVSTTYSVVATNPASGCTVTTSVYVLVLPELSDVVISPTSSAICQGDVQMLTATGGAVASEIAFGTGASTTTGNVTTAALGPNPLQNFYGGTKQQWIYKAAELTAMGFMPNTSIISLKLNLATAGTAYTLDNLVVKMKQSSVASFASNTAWVTDMTTVRAAASYTPVVGMNAIAFDAPFIWNGTDNLVVEINYSNNNGGGSVYNTAKFSPTDFVSTIFYRVDSTPAATINSFVGTANATYSARTDVSFGVNYVTPITWTSTSTGDIFTDADATLPYTGGNLSTVYVKPTAQATYTATANEGSTCSKSSEVVIAVNTVTTPDFAAITPICYSSPAPVLSTVSPNGVSGTWSPATIDNTANGTYVFTPNAGQCATTQTLNVVVTSTDAPTGTSPQDFTGGDTLSDFTVVGTGIVWYDAATNGNVLPATTAIVEGASYYAAQVVNGCESIDRLLVVAGADLKVDGFDNASFKYYPNPVSNILNVSYSEEISGLKLYNLVGQQLIVKKANATQTQIDMSQLPAGTYLLEVTSGTKVKTVKVIKNN